MFVRLIVVLTGGWAVQIDASSGEVLTARTLPAW